MLSIPHKIKNVDCQMEIIDFSLKSLGRQEIQRKSAMPLFKICFEKQPWKSHFWLTLKFQIPAIFQKFKRFPLFFNWSQVIFESI